MKIEITAENFQKEIILPKDVYFVGATMVYDDSSVNVLYSNKLHTKNEEFVFDEKNKIILHYYDSPKAKEIFETFSKSRSIKYMEIKTKVFYLSVSV